jgi:hypothetical protein
MDLLVYALPQLLEGGPCGGESNTMRLETPDQPEACAALVA